MLTWLGVGKMSGPLIIAQEINSIVLENLLSSKSLNAWGTIMKKCDLGWVDDLAD